ncbi:MAG TPA: EutN/CcmL family microcompartment protein [Bryobacteraceae bacterium]|nr:EutN/CcmL family microcompartment protein [Bryobacteraceae bacterium]
MFLGRVMGCVWATAKNPQMEGMRFLLVQPLTPELENTGKPIVCADAAGAGAGELIYWVRGREACFPFLPKEVAADATIVGIVDEVHVARDTAAPPGGKP